jgi:hypothetical protein
MGKGRSSARLPCLKMHLRDAPHLHMTVTGCDRPLLNKVANMECQWEVLKCNEVSWWYERHMNLIY